MATVKLENITKRFGDLIALDDITLDIQDQEFFVLLGQTGAGKTTTLRCIAGLDKPEAGTIYLDNVSVNDKTPAERDVAFVFQSHILYPHLSVYENMAFPLHPRRLSTEEIDRRVRDIAQMLHIEHLLMRSPNQLSGGETQRVGLGRAMVRRPQVFLMDEPISNLDAKLRTEMRAEIRWRQRELGTTTFYVTHDQIEAMSMADRIAILEAGRIQQLGTPSDIYNHPANLFVAGFIGNPSMNCIRCDISSTNGELHLKLANDTENDNSLTIQDARIAKVLNDNASHQDTIFGAHAEDVIVSHQAIPNAFQAEVYSVEPLGAETIVELTLGTDAAGARTILKAVTAPNFEAEIGQYLYVSFVPERMYFFDKTTGNAIL
ncbi:ABC transporter ATP-binding protein [Candidatus Poribacteria bacterium]|nr:ABC transporter ATP-binding protein [Candidatus Poribacteria bacterium]MYH83520.1 ABC transporter ATP-binding protein [Candidatus Poribacteria bacterium]MYK94678.1 ABC transporter ATP-binding protein [Candidatus Poribacteria bacterium]